MLGNEKKGNKSFGWTAIWNAEELGLSQMFISPTVPCSAVPHWLFLEPTVHVCRYNRGRIKIQFYLNYQKAYVQSHYFSYVHIYTDASKNIVNKVGVTFTVTEFKIQVREENF